MKRTLFALLASVMVMTAFTSPPVKENVKDNWVYSLKKPNNFTSTYWVMELNGKIDYWFVYPAVNYDRTITVFGSYWDNRPLPTGQRSRQYLITFLAPANSTEISGLYGNYTPGSYLQSWSFGIQ